MIAPETTVLVLLAAGRSLRFGEADKLAQDVSGRPLAFHAAAALAEMPFRARIAVTSGTALDFAAHGFETIRNARPEQGMASSVRLGVARACELGAQAVLIALADMPSITRAHIARLFEAADGPNAVVASSDGRRPSPPALFGAGRFDALLQLQGDEGARTLITGGRHVIAPADELIDIDRPEDLERLRLTP